MTVPWRTPLSCDCGREVTPRALTEKGVGITSAVDYRFRHALANTVIELTTRAAKTGAAPCTSAHANARH
jgi:hypothetical protein